MKRYLYLLFGIFILLGMNIVLAGGLPPNQPLIHDLAIVNHNIPSFANEDDLVTFTATVFNEGNQHEISYLRFKVDGVQKCYFYISLSQGELVTKSCNWYATEGDHTVKIRVDPVSGETDIGDNEVIGWSHVQPVQPQFCTLNVYIRDQNYYQLDANIYVDGSYKGYDDHLVTQVFTGTHVIEATRPEYYSDQQTVSCSCGETRTVYLTLLEMEEPQVFEIDVYNVEVNPYSVNDGEDVTISGIVRLTQAPSDYHIVTVEWYVDGSYKRTETYSMRETDTKSVSWNFDTSGFSEGSHNAKIRATVDSISDEDSSLFVVNGRNADVWIGSLSIDPSAICVDRDQTIELSIPVKLEEGQDDTRVTAKFYVENNEWDYIDRDERTMDVGETKTFKIYYHYDANDLNRGVHDIKVVVTAGDDEEIDLENLDVLSCDGYEDYDIYVGGITLNPEYPKKDEIVLFSVPVRLISARHLPEFVYVKAYIDSRLVYSSNIQYNYLETKTIEFTVDAKDYSEGSHTVEVEATVDTVSDRSMKRFTIGPVIIFDEEKEHCLLIDRIFIEDMLKEGEPVRVHARVSSCGAETETDVRAKLNAFSRTYYYGPFNIPAGEDREILFTVSVPEGAEGTGELEVIVWNSYTKDSWSKSFAIYTGVPLIDIKPEHKVGECKTTEISFDVINTGEVIDTFTLGITGTEWISGVPSTVALEPDEKKTITAYVSVPCETKPGLYQFTVLAKGSQRYSVTTSLRVVKAFKWPSTSWPRISFPTGWFVGIAGILYWLPWVLLLILLLILIWLLLRKYGRRLFVRSRKRPMFDCRKCGGC